MKANKLFSALIGIGLLAILCWVFPPFHIRSLKAVRAAQENQQFDATAFAARFWTEELLPAADKAVDAAIIMERIAADPGAVCTEFGRTVGVGGSCFLFLRGSGYVVSADESTVGLNLESDNGEPQIVIELGFVFGNAVRDATGLISPSSYPNAQEFNDISAALNGIVETNVLPQLQRIAKVGSRLRFAGCAEVADEELDLNPLMLVPVLVEEQKD